MSLLASPRRRRILFAAAALVAGGYLSYRVYNSPALCRKRKQLIRIIASLSFLCESASQAAESLSIVSKDLKSFLLSDGDSVPRSLRQAFKIGQCPEFQDTVTVLSAALTRGLLRGFNGNTVNHGRGGPVKLAGRHSKLIGKVHRGSQNCPAEDASCREIREVELPALRGEMKRRTKTFEGDGSVECEEKREVILNGELSRVEEGLERKIESNTSGGDLPVATLLLGSLRRGQEDNASGLSEFWLRLLFSGPGLGFASTVAGSFGRNCVIALLDEFRNQPRSTMSPFTRGFAPSLGGSPATDSLHADSQPTDKNRHKIVDILCTDGCRTLIAECVQNFVSTAVSVYIDKTKDVNFYDDMVAGITNPSHQAPMKDVLTSVCNGVVETFVRTTHDVLLVKESGQSRLDANNQQQWQIYPHADGCAKPYIESTCVGKNLHMHDRPTNLSTIHWHQQAKASGNSSQGFEVEPSSRIGDACDRDGEDTQLNEVPWKSGRKSIDLQSFIAGLSKTLAVPSNRKLFLDVAGTMTSEATKSFANVIMSTVSNYFRTKSEQGLNGGDIGISERTDNQSWQLKTESKKGMTDVAMKAFLLATVCLAICLHVFAGVRGLQNA